MRIVGFDTDAKGSVAILDCHNPQKLILDIYAVPNRVKELKNGKKRREVVYPALVAILVELTFSVHVDQFFLEDQWSRPQQDSGATFTFGKTFGDCRSAVAAGLLASGEDPKNVEERITFVPGAEWKPEMRLDSDKSKAIALASKVFPECAHAWEKTSLYTSAAEASLLALWGATRCGLKLSAGTVVHPPENAILTGASSLVCNS